MKRPAGLVMYEDPSIDRVAAECAAILLSDIEGLILNGHVPWALAREQACQAKVPEWTKVYGREVTDKVVRVIYSTSPGQLLSDAGYQRMKAEQIAFSKRYFEEAGQMTWLNRLSYRIFEGPIHRLKEAAAYHANKRASQPMYLGLLLAGAILGGVSWSAATPLASEGKRPPVTACEHSRAYSCGVVERQTRRIWDRGEVKAWQKPKAWER